MKIESLLSPYVLRINVISNKEKIATEGIIDFFCSKDMPHNVPAINTPIINDQEKNKNIS